MELSSEDLAALGVALNEAALLGVEVDRHPAPRRQLYLQLSGELELRVSDGGTRTFPAGTAFLLEDVSGKGHVTRALGTSEVRGAIVQLS